MDTTGVTWTCYYGGIASFSIDVVHAFSNCHTLPTRSKVLQQFLTLSTGYEYSQLPVALYSLTYTMLRSVFEVDYYTGVGSVCTSRDHKIMSVNESGRDNAQTQAESDSNQRLNVSDSGHGTSISTENAPELLLNACKNGRLVDVRELVAGKTVELKNCIANNPHGDTPLHIAAYFGHKDIVQYLVEEEGCEVDSRNRYQNTPLH